jgi:hypothetical protein
VAPSVGSAGAGHGRSGALAPGEKRTRKNERVDEAWATSSTRCGQTVGDDPPLVL